MIAVVAAGTAAFIFWYKFMAAPDADLGRAERLEQAGERKQMHELLEQALKDLEDAESGGDRDMAAADLSGLAERLKQLDGAQNELSSSRRDRAEKRLMELRKKRRENLMEAQAQKRRIVAGKISRLGEPLIRFFVNLDPARIEVGDKTAAQVLEQLLEEAKRPKTR